MYINKTCGCVLTEYGDIKATAQIKGLLDVYTPETSKSAFWKYWKCFICCHGDFNVQIRFADEPFGTAGELVQKMLQLFDQLHFKLGDRHFDYTLLGREQVVIDFSKCKYMSELFKEMRKKWNGTAGMAKTLMLYGIFSEECRTKVMTLQLFVPVTLQEFHTEKTPHLLIM